MTYLKSPVDVKLVEPSVMAMVNGAKTDAAVAVLEKMHGVGGDRHGYADGGSVMGQAMLPDSSSASMPENPDGE